jgi:DNA polymerase III sliding clamp (beta) subunit (PCNA family)
VIAIQGGKRDGLAAVATDGHRLVRTEAAKFGRPLQLPLRAASRLRKLAEGMDEEDELEVGFTLGTKDTRSYMFVRAGWVTLGINLAAVNYPATEQVIKGALDVSTTIEVATADLVAALRSSAAIDGRVRIELDDAGETITLAARSPDVGEGRFAVAVTEGAPRYERLKGKGCRKVLISTSLLLELVEAAELGERLELQLTNALGPIVLRRPDAHSAYLGLLMPMREGSDG